MVKNIKKNKNKIDEEKTTTTALFVGRFQPFHCGHYAVLRRLIRRHKLVKIGIGSAQYSGTFVNPLSFRERKAMIALLLKKERIKNVRIYGIPDVHDNERWVGHVGRIVGDFDVVYSGNPLVLRLFLEKGVTVKRIKKIGTYSGTHIRAAFAAGKNIVKLVPLIVLAYLKKTDRFKRVR